MQEEPVYPQYSFTILGDPTVGKSNITSRFIHDNFSEDYNPTLEGNYTKSILIGHQQYIINVTDTAGQQNYVTMEGYWAVDKNGLVYVFAIDNQKSFENITKKIEQHLLDEKLKKNQQKTPFILVANKIDLADRKVNSLKCQRFVQKYQIKYLEVSAKQKINIQQIFTFLVIQNQYQRHIKTPQPRDHDEVSIFKKIAGVCQQKCQKCLLF